jgi:hypothetical protein
MVEDAFAEPVRDREPMRRGKIDPRLPFGGGDRRLVFGHNQCHGYIPHPNVG